MTTDPVYPPPAFREARRDILLDAVRDIGFGHLISSGDDGPNATGVPFLVRVEADTIRLEAHLQRGNPQWRALAGGGAALALFQGPHAYVHPGWYESKKRDGRAVPTWNYITVHARGPATVFEDDRPWLQRHLAGLSDSREAGRPEPWAMSDAPTDYLDRLMRGVVGVSLMVARLEGRWKLSQNHPQANRLGVIDGLAGSGLARDGEVAEAMARLEGGD